MPDYGLKNLNIINPTTDYYCSVKYIHNTYIKAFTSNDSLKWCKAIEKEINTLKMNDTNELTTFPSSNTLGVGGSTILKLIKMVMNNTRISLLQEVTNKKTYQQEQN